MGMVMVRFVREESGDSRSYSRLIVHVPFDVDGQQLTTQLVSHNPRRWGKYANSLEIGTTLSSFPVILHFSTPNP